MDIFFLKKLILLFSKDALRLSKLTVNRQLYLTIYLKIFFISKYLFWAANQHIRIISVEWWDTEDE